MPGDRFINHYLLTILFGLTCLVAGCSNATEKKPPKPDKPVPEAISFGQRQVDQMLADRPDMRDALPTHHYVYGWLVEGFNGDRFGQRIYWNAKLPQGGVGASHGGPYGMYPPHIALASNADLSAIDKWAAVVYEMFNLENASDFKELDLEAVSGHWDADEYAAECVRLEFVAFKKTRDFFVEHPLPKSKHGRDTWYNWCTSNIGSFEDYEKSFNNLESTRFKSNFAYFKDYYEKTLQPYAKARQ